MNQELGPQIGTGSEREYSLSERLARIQTTTELRDAKQTALLQLIAEPEKAGRTLTDAWLDLESAQAELDQLFKDEIQSRLAR